MAIRRHVGTGGIVLNAEDCINFLERKYQSKENPNFVLKLISKESLLSARQGDQFSTTQGSSKFHVMIFSPNSNSFKAAPYLCVCDSCLTDYGSCDLFQPYDVPVPQKKRRPPTLRSNDNEKSKDPIVDVITKQDDITPGTVCAVASEEKSSDTFWLIKIDHLNSGSSFPVTDDYGHTVPVNQAYFQGQFLERDYTTKTGTHYSVSKKKTFFYFESIVYPFVNLNSTKKGFELTNSENLLISNYVEGITWF